MSRLDRAVADHRAAASKFAARVERVSPAQWAVPRLPGKWSLAEEALHIRVAYDVLLDALNGGPGLRPRVSSVWSAILRNVFLPLCILAQRLPSGIRAPREVKPDSTAANVAPADRAVEIRQRAASFEAVLAETAAAGRTVALRHPYFGLLGHAQGLRFIALHTRHHMRHFPL